MKRAVTRRQCRRGNPIEQAGELSEVFHGRPADRVTVYEEEIHEHAALADLGRLTMLVMKDGTRIQFEKKTRLGSNEAGTQLFFVGGDQSVNPEDFNQDPNKESVCLGPVKKIEYVTSKEHLGKADKTPGPYIHTFGEEGGSLPLLCYDTLNQQLALVGGSYHIDRDMDGEYSAGIRD